MNAPSSLLLVVATAAIGLGLAAVTASLTSPVPADAQGESLIGKGDGLALVQRDEPGVALGRSSPLLGTLSGAPTPAARPRPSAGGPWASPLYPQNGVTLWDRIRVSSQRDRRAFLLGTAIQVHAPAIAATPGP